MILLKRLILFVVAVVVIGLAIAVSGFNTEKIMLDLYISKLEISLGFALMATLFVGLLVGLFMAIFSFYMPLKSQIRQLRRKNHQIQSQARLVHSDD